MDSTGICDICGKPGKLFTCMLCGKRACLGCFVLDKGVCKPCLGGRRMQEKPGTIR